MARDRIRLILLAVTCVGLALGQVPCKVNTTKFPPMACPVGSMCCPQPATPRCSDNPLICTVCAECCHDDLSQNATACANCAKAQCTDPAAYSDMGCRQPESSTCCGRGLPLNASRTLPNCLLIGDSVTNGLFPQVAGMLANVCQVQHIEGIGAGSEGECFWSQSITALAAPVKWDVIQFNEGLHSLWPRVNTSNQLQQWAWELGNFTLMLQHTGARLIYATMTPYMPEKFLNPPGTPQNDVEIKNKVAVETVQALGVSHINDLYSVVTGHCGKIYRSCDICANETIYHPGIECGFHYTTAGYQLLANATNLAIRELL